MNTDSFNPHIILWGYDCQHHIKDKKTEALLNNLPKFTDLNASLTSNK